MNAAHTYLGSRCRGLRLSLLHSSTYEYDGRIDLWSVFTPQPQKRPFRLLLSLEYDHAPWGTIPRFRGQKQGRVDAVILARWLYYCADRQAVWPLWFREPLGASTRSTGRHSRPMSTPGGRGGSVTCRGPSHFLWFYGFTHPARPALPSVSWCKISKSP
jgi:hypothetical protein